MPKLVVHDTDRTYLVDLRPGESLIVGRSLECDLPIAAQRASRRHAEIVAGDSGYTLRDLGSTNGTTVNGTPLTGEATLEDGDALDLGGCRIEYRSRP